MATTLMQRKEAEARRLDAALAALARGRSRDRTPEALVQQVFDAPQHTRWRNAPELAQRLAALRRERQGRKATEDLRAVLEAVATRAPRMLEADAETGVDYVAALGRLAEQSRNWVRHPAAFRPVHRSPERAFGELARHLLAHYPVPRFLDQVFLSPRNQVPTNWFAYLGGGGSPLHLPGLTMALTRRMGHHFLQAPGSLPVLQALRWGQVRGLRGGLRLARAVCEAFPGRMQFSAELEEWLVTVLRWLALHDDINPAVVDTLLNYLWHRNAQEAGFAVAGRSPLAVLQLAREWNRETVGTVVRPDQRFEPSGYPGGVWELGEGLDRAVWCVEEILDMRALRAEGRAMKHCVATYASEIAEGECAIWSLQRDGLQATRRAVTIQVERSSGRIVQVRGKLNRDPTRVEKAVIARWAAEAGLTPAFDWQDPL